ncbi:MAG: PAS domain S-box protein [Verrucomicrobia bacterium]|nr:PAS domain S-box protein [Verrucomicrobiota bacterium]
MFSPKISSNPQPATRMHPTPPASTPPEATLWTNDSRTVLHFILIFVMLAAGIVAAGYHYYLRQAQQFRSAVELQLVAITELKIRELAQWRVERLEDCGILFKNAAFTALVRRHLAEPEDQDTLQQLRTWLGRFGMHARYDQISLLDTQGVTRLALPDAQSPVSSIVAEHAAVALRTDQMVFQDFYRSTVDGQIRLAVLVPIHDEADGQRPLGVIVMRINPNIYLYPFICRWPVSSETAETLLVRREGNEVVFLNELRFQKNTALTLRSPLTNTLLPAVKAALGQQGVVEGIDYRGTPVLAALGAVPDSPWFLVARRDVAEVFAPLRPLLWQVIAMVGALFLAAAAGVGMIWRQQRVRFFRVRAEALRESEVRFHQIADSLPQLVWTCQPDGPCDYFNRRWIEFTGVPETRQLGFGWLEQLHPDDRTPTVAAWEAAVAAGTAFRVEYRIRGHDGEYRWFDTQAARLSDAAGHTVKWFGSNTDITERKRVAAELKTSEERYRTMFNSMMEGFCIIEVMFDEQDRPNDYRFLEINPAFEAQTGLRNAQGKRMRELAPQHEAHWFELYGKVAVTGEPIQFENEAKELQRSFAVSAYRVCGQGSRKVGILFNDITERNLAKAVLHREQEFVRTLLDNLADGVVACDAEGQLTLFNRAAREWHGMDALALPPAEWGRHYDLYGPDGTTPLPTESIPLFRAFRGETVRDAGMVIVAQGQPPRHILAAGDSFHDARHNLLGAVVVMRDITARKQAEAELQAKNAELERFLHAVSHDLKSPAVTVRTFLGYLAQDLAAADAGRIEKDLRFIHAAADKMTCLLDDLLELARVGRVGNRPVKITFRELVAQALAAVAGRIAHRGVTVAVGEHAVSLLGDRLRLAEIWQNLIENACKFMGDQPAPRIEIGLEMRGAEPVFFVRDNGIGLDPSHHARIFNLFEKLDPSAEGTGLGLALIKRIVDLSLGRIWVASPGPGQGTCFHFTLPAALQQDAPMPCP